MYGHPELWAVLLRRLADITIAFLQVQVAGGSLRRAAVRLLGRDRSARTTTARSVLPYSRQIFAALAATGVPQHPFRRRHRRTARPARRGGRRRRGVDWRVPLDEAVHRVAPGKALQGNLDPAVLLAPWPVIEERARQVLEKGRTAESHIFNLGHGVLPDTDPDVLARLTDLVHAACPPDPRQRLARASGAASCRWRLGAVGGVFRRCDPAPAPYAMPPSSATRMRNGSAEPSAVSTADDDARARASQPRRPATNPALSSCACLTGRAW